MEFLDTYIWLIAHKISFNDWKLEVMWSFIDVVSMIVDLAYLLFDPMSQLVVESSYFECFLMVWSLLDPFGLSLAPQNPTNRFTHLSLRGTLFTLRRFVIFYHSRGIIFIGILCYDSYYVKNHPPKYFQVHIFLFHWILGAVTFQICLEFSPYIFLP